MINFIEDLFVKYEKSRLSVHIEKNPGLIAICIGLITITLTVFFGIKSVVPDNKKTSDTLPSIATEVYPNCEHENKFILLNQ